jgi:ectoine hydroxylase-related dioxygenase (phytanoyl-CoA dioxygenase family)
MRLTPEQKKFWQDNGYLAVENVIPTDLIAQERERFDWWCRHFDIPEAQNVGIGHETGLPREKWSARTVRKFHGLVQHEPVFRQHALHPNLLDIVADLIGTPFSLYENQALLKPPSLGSPKPAHQDNAYFKVNPADAVITCWGAIDDATLENGCMRYFPGSHTLGAIEHKWIQDTPHQVPDGFDVKEAVPIPLKAGGVAFHHSQTMHLSLENRSQNWRRSFICHYCRDNADLSQASTPREKLMQVRD